MSGNQVSACRRCPLREGCGQVVVGGGAAQGLMVVGGTPSEEEDLMGEPFMARQGLFIRKLLHKHGLQAYLTYAVKCWPKGTAPTKQHTNACKAWLLDEVRSVRPKVILTLGLFATRSLLTLPSRTTLSDVLGKPHCVVGPEATVVPWYGETSLLNNGKKIVAATETLLRQVREMMNESVRLFPIEGQAGEGS